LEDQHQNSVKSKTKLRKAISRRKLGRK
jgi:hypothetical protein